MHYGKLFLLAMVFALSACEKQSQSITSEKIATWKSGYVTKAELDHAVEQLGKVDENQLNAIRTQALDELINQKLIFSAAEKSGLTNNPNVVLDEELAKRQVVARAYAKSVSTGLPKPTSQEVDDYYAQNDQLFSQRRVYQLQEIKVKANQTQADAIKEQLGKSESLAELVSWLKTQNLPVSAQGGVKPAEQLPEALRNQLAKMSSGQVALFPAEGGLVILQVQGIQNQPLNKEQATPLIEKLLLVKKQKEAIESDVKKMRDAVKIQYASGYDQPLKQ